MLFAMRLRGVINGAKRHPSRYIIGFGFLALVYWGIYSMTRQGVRFLDSYPGIDMIADAIAQRSIEALFVILMLGVAFSVLTTAITTLYSSEDLPFLLSLPVDAVHVFYLKVTETYLNAALLPAIFTLPALVGLGVERGAPLSYYPIALAAILALYAIPVAIGSFFALFLMRIAPAGRVKELSTALSVFLAAGLIFGLRALRPEQIMAFSDEEFQQFLAQFASLEVSWLPSNWASQAVWSALSGGVSGATYLLALISLLLLWVIARLAAFAYREGWVRSLESGNPKLDPRVLPAALWERGFYRFGRIGSVIVKDIRLLLRDPTQWSQLLVLLALAGVYLVSVSSVSVEGEGGLSAANIQLFRDVLGTMNLMFLGFLLAGIGVRTAYPIVSLEGEGFWMLRTGPLRSIDIVMTKFWNAVPIMAILGAGLGFAAARLIDVSPILAFVSPIAGLCAAVATTGLGVGLGAAYPRFDATNPAEIPLSPGGLLYMTLSLLYAAAMTVMLALPAWQALRPSSWFPIGARPSGFYWLQPQGLMLLAAILLFTALVTLLPLLYGSRQLSMYESGSS